MAKDAIGNELKVGDWCLQELTNGGRIIGQITKISDGGLAVVGGTRGKQGEQQMVTAGSVTLVSETSAASDPRDGRAPSLFKIVVPDDEKQKSAIVM